MFVLSVFSVTYLSRLTITIIDTIPGPYIYTVPPKVWNINAPDGELDVAYDTSKSTTKQKPAEWWTQECLTNLDLSSNVLITISPEIGNLQDLTVLNVSQ